MVILPVVYVADVPDNVVIVPTPAFMFPLNVVAVTTPVNLPSPETCNLLVGSVVPIPIAPVAGTKTI